MPVAATKQIVYSGSGPGRIIPGVGRAAAGEPIDVPIQLAKSLLEQDCWTEPKATKARSKE